MKEDRILFIILQLGALGGTMGMACLPGSSGTRLSATSQVFWKPAWTGMPGRLGLVGLCLSAGSQLGQSLRALLAG